MFNYLSHSLQQITLFTGTLQGEQEASHRVAGVSTVKYTDEAHNQIPRP